MTIINKISYKNFIGSAQDNDLSIAITHIKCQISYQESQVLGVTIASTLEHGHVEPKLFASFSRTRTSS